MNRTPRSKRPWGTYIGVGCSVIIALLILGFYIAVGYFASGIKETPDNFGKDIKIPKGMVLRNPATPEKLNAWHITSDKAEMILGEGGQLGMYCVRASVNPGEAGTLYLKAYEITRGTPLSVDSLPYSTSRKIAKPSKPVYYKANFSIYEGDWYVYYPARFELWFKPLSGKKERRLIMQQYKICGWER